MHGGGLIHVVGSGAAARAERHAARDARRRQRARSQHAGARRVPRLFSVPAAAAGRRLFSQRVLVPRAPLAARRRAAAAEARLRRQDGRAPLTIHALGEEARKGAPAARASPARCASRSCARWTPRAANPHPARTEQPCGPRGATGRNTRVAAHPRFRGCNASSCSIGAGSGRVAGPVVVDKPCVGHDAGAHLRRGANIPVLTS